MVGDVQKRFMGALSRQGVLSAIRRASDREPSRSSAALCACRRLLGFRKHGYSTAPSNSAGGSSSLWPTPIDRARAEAAVRYRRDAPC